MLEGMYAAAAGMEAQQQRLAAVSNDLANSGTAGYKRVRVAFRDLLYTQSGRGGGAGVVSGAGAAAVSLGRYEEAGALQQTGRPLDLALLGTGYLAVTDPTGRTALTRNGTLERQADGRLTTATGQFTGVRIPTNVADSAIDIAPDGTVSSGGKRFGKLSLVTVGAPEGLQPTGDSLFLPTAASGAPVAAGTRLRVQQGTLEASNVDTGDTMVELIDAQRSYELASKAITTQDQLLEIANGVKR